MDTRSFLIVILPILFCVNLSSSDECKPHIQKTKVYKVADEIYYWFRFDKYHSYDEIWHYLSDLSLQYSDKLTIEPMGYSFEGRAMKFVKISNNPNANNPVILVEAGTHAREWAAVATSLYLIFDIINQPEKYNLNEFDWYIVPVSNPDGYEFTRSSEDNRYWRKNRSKGGCIGVDLNRNYGFKWGVSGVDKNCDKEIYPGPKEFSEVESRNLRDLMVKYSERIKLYIALHAFGNYLVYPYGYSNEVKPKTWPILHRMAKDAAAAIKICHGTEYKIMSSGEWYEGAGGSDDFAFASIGIPFVYTMEISDNFGFEVPEDQLGPVFVETTMGFSTFAKNLTHYLKMVNTID